MGENTSAVYIVETEELRPPQAASDERIEWFRDMKGRGGGQRRWVGDLSGVRKKGRECIEGILNTEKRCRLIAKMIEGE